MSIAKPVIYFFVKTFSDRLHAEEFLDGRLYMNSLDYFVRLEESASIGRGDRHEGVEAWLQSNEIQLEINGFRIDSADIAQPVSIRSDRQLSRNVFCMHAGYVGGNAPSEFATPSEFEQQLRVPIENISLGQHSILITNIREFLQRVKNAAGERGVALYDRLVNYYDPTTFTGFFAEEDAPFNKQKQFAHQREYRLVVSRPVIDASAYSLNLGSLRDIAYPVPIEAINAGIKISRLANDSQD